MKKLLLLLTLFVGITTNAQEQVSIWIDVTDESLIETHVNKANDAIVTLLAKNNNIEVSVMKISHNPFGDSFEPVTISSGPSDNPIKRKKHLGNGIAKLKAILTVGNFPYESSKNTAIYDNLSIYIDNGNSMDRAIIFSDFEENTSLSKDTLSFKNAKISGIISARDGVPNMAAANKWKVIIPNIKLMSRFKVLKP